MGLLIGLAIHHIPITLFIGDSLIMRERIIIWGIELYIHLTLEGRRLGCDDAILLYIPCQVVGQQAVYLHIARP